MWILQTVPFQQEIMINLAAKGVDDVIFGDFFFLNPSTLCACSRNPAVVISFQLKYICTIKFYVVRRISQLRLP